MNKSLKTGTVLLIVAGISVGLWMYWQHETLYPSTQDAYVQANVITVAAEVTGKVVAVHVEENQLVEAGDSLFDIDNTVYKNAVTQAQAGLDSANDTTKSYKEQISASTATVDSFRSARDTAKAQLERVQKLFDDGDVSPADLDIAQTDAATAESSLRGAVAALASAETSLAAHLNEVIAARAALQTSQLNFARSTVTAPVNGWVTNLSLRTGSMVTAYESLFSLVDNSQWWLDGNFKETDLSRVAVGQPVSFTVDMLPGDSFTGSVDSIAYGSGSTFSLLPAENASGNWVKVTQRFTVRVRPDSIDPRLRVGASADVTIDTTGNSR